MPLNHEIYQEHILDHFEEPFHRGRCPNPTHAHEDDNPLCGDTVRIELAVDPDGTIQDAWFEGDGCCISQAATSMLLERMSGRKLSEAKTFTAGDMLQMFGAKLTPNRQKCCLLPWRVLQSAVYSTLSNAPAGAAKAHAEIAKAALASTASGSSVLANTSPRR